MGTRARANNTSGVRGAIGSPRCARDDGSSLRSAMEPVFNLKQLQIPRAQARS